MLINLLPDFLLVLEAADREAAYRQYREAHRLILDAYWRNYVLDPETPHADEIVAAALKADRSDLYALAASTDIVQLAEEAIARAEELIGVDGPTDTYLMVGLGGANAGELVVGGRGVAFVQYDRTEAYVAAVAEVEINQADGQVRVKRVVVAHDCGLIINPDGLRNQIEGNVIQATSRSLKEEVKFDSSIVTSLDWTAYPILRFPEIPEVLVELINRPDQPAVGAGEATTSAIPAAIANAIFDATGARLRTIPFTPDRVKAGLS